MADDNKLEMLALPDALRDEYADISVGPGRLADENHRLHSVLADLAKLAGNPGGLAEHAAAIMGILETAGHKVDRSVGYTEEYAVIRKPVLDDLGHEVGRLRDIVSHVGNVLNTAQSQNRSTISPAEIKELREHIEAANIGYERRQQASQRQLTQVEQSQLRGFSR